MFILPVYLVTFSAYAGGSYAKLQIAIIIATYFIAELSIVPVLGSLSDQWGRKPFLIAGPFIAAISMLGFSFSTNFYILAIAHAIQGIGAAAKVAPTIAFIADASDPNERGEKMGSYDTVNFGGIGVGLLLGAFLADWAEIKPTVVSNTVKPQVFYVLALILAIAGVLTYLYVREFPLLGHTKEEQILQAPMQTTDHFTAVLDTFKNREFRRFAPSWFSIMMIIGMATTFLPIILGGEGVEGGHGAGSSVESAITMVAGVGLIAATQPIFGRWSDKYGRKPFLLIGSVSAMVAIISLGFAVSEFLLQGKKLTTELIRPQNFIITIPLLIGILGAGAFGPSALALLADVTKAEKRGQAMGVYSFMLGLGEIMGDLVGGFMWDFFEARYGSGPIGIVVLGSTLSIIAVIVVVKYILETRYLDDFVIQRVKIEDSEEITES
jgi:MFS family permease